MKNRAEISDDLIRELPTFQSALRACVMFSGMQPKEVAFELDIAGDHFSKTLTPSDDPRHFPPNKLLRLMDVCGNEIPLRWLSLKRGYPPPRSIEALEAEIARLERENEALRAEAKSVFNVFKFMELKE